MKEISLASQDTDRIISSIELTRKIRGVALGAQGLGLSPEETHAKEQKLLTQAEVLAVPTVRLLTSYIGSTTHTDERAAFDAVFAPLNERYEDISEFSAYGLSSTSPFTNLLDNARMITSRWESFYRYYYGYLNKIPLSLSELLSDDVGIMSPLSGDYLASVFHKEAVTQFIQPTCFDVKPVAIDRDARRAILRTTLDKQPIFADKRVLGVSVDTVNKGTTASVVFEATQRAYPNKVIYSAVSAEQRRR